MPTLLREYASPTARQNLECERNPSHGSHIEAQNLFLARFDAIQAVNPKPRDNFPNGVHPLSAYFGGN